MTLIPSRDQGTDGSAAPNRSKLIAGKDGSGDQQDISVDTSGYVNVNATLTPSGTQDVNMKQYGGSAVGATNAVHVQPGTGAVFQVGDNSSTLSVDDGAGSLTVDGTVAISGTPQVIGSVAHDGVDADGPVKIGGYAKAAAPTDVSADGDRVNAWYLRNGAAATVLTAAGALIGGDATNGLDVDVTRVTGTVTIAGAVTNAGTFAVQDSEKVTDNAAFTDGTTKVQPAGYIYDEVAGTALTENDAAAARINVNRAQVQTIEDGSTRGRYATVTAANALKVDASGVAVPVTDNSSSLTVDNGGTFVVQENGAALTSLQLIDDIIYTDDTSTHSTGTSKGALMMAAATPTDTAVNANDIGAVGMTNNRELYASLRDISGTAAVSGSGTATGALRVELPTNGTGVVATVTSLTQMNGQAIAMGTGVRSAGTQRVTIATDDVVPASQSGNWTSRIVGNAGATLDSTVGAGTAPTNQIVTGQVYNTSAPAPTNGQAMAMQSDQAGNHRVFPGIALTTLSNWTSATSINTTQNIFTNSGASAVLVQTDTTSTVSGGAITFEGTYDGTNWVTIAANQALDPTSTSLAQISLPYTLVASTNKPFLILTHGMQGLRIKLSTAITGTATLTPYYALLASNPAQETIAYSPTAANFNATVNVSQLAGTTTAVNNGTASNGTLRVTVASDSTGNIATIGTSVTPGTAAANLGKAEDSAHTTGDTGVMTLGVRKATLADLSAGATDGDYEPYQVNRDGAMWVVGAAGPTGGWSIATGSIAATKTDIGTANTAGQVGGWYFYNPNASVAYVQFFNTQASGVTLGTTAPVYSLGIPATSAANVAPGMVGLAHSTAISIAVTTTRAGSTGPGSTVDYNIWYKQ